MKKIILFTLALAFFYSCAQKQDSTKQLIIHFPDSTEEKTVTLRYSIENIISMFYDRYSETQTITDNILVFEIPDSISVFLMQINAYQRSKNRTLFMLPGEKLEIALDTTLQAQFKGKYADFHKHIFNINVPPRGMSRVEKMIADFSNSSKISFSVFVNNQIIENLDVFSTLLDNKQINEKQFLFAESHIIEQFLFQVARIGFFEKYYLAITDSVSFFNELNNLFLLYDRVLDYGKMSTQFKASRIPSV